MEGGGQPNKKLSAKKNMKLQEIKDKWIRVAVEHSKDDKSLYRYLRDGGLNHIQAKYVIDLKNTSKGQYEGL